MVKREELRVPFSAPTLTFPQYQHAALMLSRANLYTSTHSYTCLPIHTYTPSHLHTYTLLCVIRALQQMKHRPGTRLKAQKKKKGETEVRCWHWECVRRVLLLLKDGLCCPIMPRGSFHITHHTHITTTHTPQHHTPHTTQHTNMCARTQHPLSPFATR